MKNLGSPKCWLFGLLLLSFSLTSAYAQQWLIDVETGAVFSGYNDVRIPGNSGTDFSLVNDLSTPASPFFRFRIGYQITSRQAVSLLIAPLSVDGSGEVDFRLSFNGVDFPAQTPLKSIYKFNSYRLSYRYTLVKKEKLEFGLGLTAKIRDAAIRLEGGGLRSEKTNVGFVPLINFLLEWRLSPTFRLLLDGDALAAPQGRAEDVLLAIVYQKSPQWAFRAGYRILEGGADNDEVYGFALFHYLTVGAVYYFK